MKPTTESPKSTADKPKARPNRAGSAGAQPKSNLKAAFGKYKGVIVEKDDCWDEDLKKTILDG